MVNRAYHPVLGGANLLSLNGGPKGGFLLLIARQRLIGQRAYLRRIVRQRALGLVLGLAQRRQRPAFPADVQAEKELTLFDFFPLADINAVDLPRLKG